MCTILEQYRVQKGLTYEKLGASAGFDKGNAYRHCQAEFPPGEAALRYHHALGIPLEELRPDIFSPPTPPADAGKE